MSEQILSPKKKLLLSEDWLAVLIGGSTILIFLLSAILDPARVFSFPTYKWETTSDLATKILSLENLFLIGKIWLIVLSLAVVAYLFQEGNIKRFITGFSLIYAMGTVSLIIAGNKTINYYGLEYVIFALPIGLTIRNIFTLPAWLQEAARSEFFIKTGLVILGTSILFNDIIQAGLPGLLQAIVVVLVVWFFSIWLSRALKIDDEFGVMLASAVSICGVSAAIVACGVIEGDKKKLSYVTTLVILIALPMLVLQPWIIKTLQIPDLVGGAWLGGTLDTTASVTAAGQLIGPVATKAGVIVKFSQNVLIGAVAFLLSIWWAFRTKKSGTATVNFGVIWERFPKFVIGFILASVLFSFAVPVHITKTISGTLNSFRVLWFSLAFVSIGLEARFSDLIKLQGGKPALVFTSAQLFNILWALLWTYLLFGGVFPVPHIK